MEKIDARKYVPRPASRSETGLFYTIELEQDKQPVGRLTFANGDVLEFTDPTEYVDRLREEIEFISSTGMKYETLTDDPQTRKAVDDIVYGLYGEENPRPLEDYKVSTPTMEMGGM